jgi:oligopeptide/dipeptide ABC transporter ATP-binding protein
VSAFVEPAAVERDVAWRGSFLAGLMRQPIAIATIAFLAVLTLACLAASLIAPYDPRAQDLARVLSGPTSHNLLGTDTLGRDILSRLLYGGRRSLLSIVEGVSVVLVLGVPLGLAAGYVGGLTDRMLSRFAEMVLAIPAIILILVVLALVPHNEDAAMLTFGLLGAPTVLRVVRGTTLKIRDELYVVAARVSGLSHLRIVVRHILPRVSGPIIVQASLFAAYALLFETAIAFLGLTADPSTPTWGGMIGEASTVIEQHSWLLVPTGAVIASTILALGLLGDAVRDAAVMDAVTSTRQPRRSPPGETSDDAAVAADPAPPERHDALLQVRGLSVALAGEASETIVVDRVSFDVLPGETVGFVGESGCGKTLTALAVLRLLPRGVAPVRGEVRWADTNLLEMSDRDFDELRGSTLAYVAQEPQASLDPTFTVGSQLVEVIRRHERISRSRAKERALELLALVELPNPEQVAQARAHELSGGMAQRVAMALALAGRPKLLIADEPTTALDVTVQAEILGLLRRLQEETGMAIVVITHNWGVVADLCDRTLVMYAGQVVEQSAAQAMFDQPMHPYTLGLLESHPSLAEAGKPLSSMRGGVPSPGAWPSGCRFAARCRFATDACVAGPIPLLEADDDRLSRCIRVDQLIAEVTV